MTDQWIENQKAVLPQTTWQHITFTMPGELWVLFQYNRELQNHLSRLAAKPLLTIAGKKGLKPGIFTALHTFGRGLNLNIHIHLSTTLGGLSEDEKSWENLYFDKKSVVSMWRYEIINLLRQAYKRGELRLPKPLKAACPTLTQFNSWLDNHYKKSWIVHFAEPSKDHERTTKYLGRYLKRPAVSMSRLKHYDGRTVTFQYLNHKTKRYKRFTCEAEDFIKRIVQHIPDKGFRLIRYFGFLANRVRSKLLPKVYDLLDQPEKKALKIRFPALLKSSFGIDPLKCILCGAQMIKTGIVPGLKWAQLRNSHPALALSKKMILK